MAVPKTIETRCRDGSVQARQVIYKKNTQAAPSLHHFLYLKFCEFGEEITGNISVQLKMM